MFEKPCLTPPQPAAIENRPSAPKNRKSPRRQRRPADAGPGLLPRWCAEAAALDPAAAERLQRWSRAFDAWLEELQRSGNRREYTHTIHAWRRLLPERRKLPWELAAADIAAHAAWMHAQGYAAYTIRSTLRSFARFYGWCGARRADPECGPGFNPAAGVKWPNSKLFVRADGSPAPLLGRADIDGLLGVLRLDASPLGRRDYAFILARLRLGVPLQSLRMLKWEQICPVVDHPSSVVHRLSSSLVRPSSVFVQWRPEADPQSLPDEVWAAIRDYLAVSGRLAGMAAGKYIFSGLKEPLQDGQGWAAGDWKEAQPEAASVLNRNLKRYGRAAGISAERLTLRALRLTAHRLKLDAGADLAEMQAFMDSRASAKVTKTHLARLPELPPGSIPPLEGAELGRRVPDREPHRFLPGDNRTHGLYARSRAASEVEAILAEDVQGLEAEITGLRWLACGLFERQEQAARWEEGAGRIDPAGREELVQLIDAFSHATSQVGELVRVDLELAKHGRQQAEASAQWDSMRRALADVSSLAPGEEPQGGKAGVFKVEPLLAREIAALRLVLRRAYRLAQEAETTREYLQLVRVYGVSCARLARLLKLRTGENEKLEAELKAVIDRALREVVEELSGAGEAELGGHTQDWDLPLPVV